MISGDGSAVCAKLAALKKWQGLNVDVRALSARSNK